MYLALKFLLMVLLFMNGHHRVDCGSKVKYLPGFEGPLPFELETGYIGVGEKEEQQMFYYFIKSESNPKEDPLLLWLSGGPGCSSLIGLILENGPLTLKVEAYNGSIPSLVSTTYSWTKMANIIFLDQPVGSGFSYSRTPLVDKASDTSEVKRIHEFLQKWLSKHPQFYSNPFYGAGDSYAGMIIPALVHEISKGNYICCEPPINIQGYMLGNPKTNNTFDNSFRVPYAHGMALISDELSESMKKNCKGNYVNVNLQTKECLKLIKDFQMCTNKIKIYHILTPDCNITLPDCYYHYYFRFEKWANEESVREALHVKKGSIDKWFQCNKKLQRSEGYIKDIKSSIPYHILNSINDYKSLIYSGDHDMAVPFLSTQAWIKSLNYSIIDDWRPWLINDQIAGYTRNYANKMTFATVKGSGHTIEYRPNEGFIMFQRWISGNPL